MLEDIESTEQFDIALNDIEQICTGLGVQPFKLFVPRGTADATPTDIQKRQGFLPVTSGVIASSDE